MDLLIILTYTACCILIFKLFKIPLNKWTVPTAVLGGIFIVGALLLLMNYNHPYTKLAQDYFFATPVVPAVRGRVVEVNVTPNTQLKEGDPLFKIDPEPFQAVVDQFEAELAAARQRVKQLQSEVEESRSQLDKVKADRDLARDTYYRYRDGKKKGALYTEQQVDDRQKTYLASEAQVRVAQAALEQAELAFNSVIDGENTEVAKLKGQLKKARFDLEQTVVRAPTDGYVTQMALRPGMMAVPLPLRPVMVFVHKEDHMLVAGFQQNSLQRLKPGYQAEVIFNALPGKVFQARVVDIIPAMGEGQFQPGGSLLESARFKTNGRAIAKIKVEDDLSGYLLPGGVNAEVAVYSEYLHHVAIIRKVLLRMNSWKNFIFMEGH